MKNKWKITGLTLATITLLAGCGKTTASTGNGKYAAQQTYNLMSSTELETMDPSLSDDQASGVQLQNTNEGLYHTDRNGKVTPAAAKSTTVSKDGKTYTFHLRKGMKWSNGDPVTAANFVYGWQRSVNPNTKAPNAFLFTAVKNADAIESGKKQPSSLGVKAVDKYTFRVSLEKSAPYLKKLTTLMAFFPQDKKVVQKYGKAYGTTSAKTVYNGSFVQKGWTGSNLSWKLVKNKNYWDKKHVHLQTVNMKVVQNPSTALSLYQSKKLDDITLSGQQAAQEKNNKAYYSVMDNRTDYADYNFKVKAMKNLNIRRALSLVLNRNQLATKVLANGAKAPKGFVPAGFATNPKTGKDFASEAEVANTVTKNKALAKKYWAKGLKQLGVSKLTISLMCWDGDANKQTAEYVQSAVNQTLKGANVEVNSLPKKTAITRMSAHSGWDMALTSWGPDFLDLMDFLQLEETGNAYNFGSYSNKQFDKYMELAADRDANNEEKRYDDYLKAEKILMKDQAVSPMDQPALTYLHNPKVKDATTTASGGTYLKSAYVAK
ncbi:peptide ABC transporter substrate-binding protein [Pediococcus siamensis]|uniref:peptide ABC transporter substrate-binding protein n=1 Tax=Pediococcus siamensis TaxID=381829 RepID=UPI00399F0014